LVEFTWRVANVFHSVTVACESKHLLMVNLLCYALLVLLFIVYFYYFILFYTTISIN